MPFQKVNGIQIYYEEQGSGEPLILINGLAFPMDLWFAQIEELSKDFRVIAPDNRGIGHTDKPNDPYTIPLMASDIVELLKALGIDRAHVAGLSMGGFIAQEIAISHPEVVDRLVLIATGLSGLKAQEMGKPFWEKVAAQIQGKTAEQIYRIDLTLMSAPGFVQKHPDVLNQAIKLRLIKRQPLYAFLCQSAACNVFDSSLRIQSIAMPTLIILGKDDPLFPMELADDFHKALPQAKMIIYEDCGHAIPLEKAGQLSKDIREFLIH